MEEAGQQPSEDSKVLMGESTAPARRGRARKRKSAADKSKKFQCLTTKEMSSRLQREQYT